MARAMRQGSPTPSVTTTSPATRPRQREPGRVVELGRPPAPHTGRHVVEHELPGHAGPWRIPASDDVGHDGCVRDAERVAELTREMPGALVDVRLVDGEQAPLRDRPRRLERGRDLRGVVPVVVEDPDAALVADELEAPVDPGEARERSLCVPALDPRELEGCERRRSVAPVVGARDAQLALERLRAPGRARPKAPP